MDTPTFSILWQKKECTVEYYREYVAKCDKCKHDCSIVMNSQKLGESFENPRVASICQTCEGSGKITHTVHYSWFFSDGKIRLTCTDCKGLPIKWI